MGSRNKCVDVGGTVGGIVGGTVGGFVTVGESMAGVVIGAAGGAVGGAVGGAAGGTVSWAVGLASGGGVSETVGRIVNGVMGESMDGAVGESMDVAVSRLVSVAVGESMDGAVGESMDGAVNEDAALARHHLEKKENRSSEFTDYGDIMKVETAGASLKTSQQDRLEYGGVKASEAMAKTDAGRLERYRSIIKTVGRQYGVDPALIAAIISRESRAGKALDDGWGDHGRGWGLMQLDVNPGHHIKRGVWDSEEHLSQATEILVHFIKRIQKKFPGTKSGGIAAYNMGDGSVHSYENVDEKTTGGDYSNDVVARAQWYKNNLDY